jgi:hypothetical protein
MLRRIRETSGNGLTAAISSGAIAGLAAAALSVTVLGDNLLAPNAARAAIAQQGATEFSINRSTKTDSLPVPNTPQTRAEIKSVEVVGVRGASIVYRDRSGNVLFQTDPLANVTVVTKNVELPEVTVREAETTKVERIPADEAQRSEQPRGCESEFARPAPEALTRTSSRCVTDLGNTPRKFAALR